MENRVCFTFFKPNVSQHLFTLPRSLPSLSRYTLFCSLQSHFLTLSHPPSVSLTLFDQSLLPVPWSLPYPFRTLTILVAVDYRYVALPFYCFLLWEMDNYQRGISHYQNLQFFSICFMGMTQVQVLCKEEKMIISASYIFYYLKMCCWKSSVWYCQNKGLLWKEQNSCIFEDTNWSKTRLESLLIRTLVDWSRAWGA